MASCAHFNGTASASMDRLRLAAWLESIFQVGMGYRAFGFFSWVNSMQLLLHSAPVLCRFLVSVPIFVSGLSFT